MITIKRMSDCTFAEVTKAWNRGFEGYFVSIVMTEEMLVQRLGNEGYVMGLSVVAFDGEEPIGLVASGLRTIGGKKVAWNGGTGVATEYRRQGVGRQLIDATLELYKEAGVQVAILEAMSQNSKAIALYEQKGYEVVDRLLFWQRIGPLPEHAFGASTKPEYRIRPIVTQEVTALPFYDGDVAWQNQWQSLRDAQAVMVEDGAGQAVGYALYKSMVNEAGQVSNIVLRQCVAQPGHSDARNILSAALARVYAPYASDCKRSTFNLRASEGLLLEILESAGFGPSETEQVYMVMQMETAQE
ncbi:GNAT family N-acetyltransferase [Brevibacillus parabrevis]|uniref:GNAT family N-acetyltransferase n=1 Tax=Brevibacillus parabrevis TaxID=54914 RepID=UPI0028536CA2|nr:GNAT family N-acetyltransferase [Brevibacillus parabrevis]MDR4997720.1 GNAT family N-acetyltransferase [Brevibacillus parabrevis]